MFKFSAGEKLVIRIFQYAREVNAKRYNRNFRNNDLGNHRILREAVGKLGEFGACKVYGGVPDLELRENGTFYFDHDLNPGVHVKTCSFQERARSDSWTFDKKDPIVKSPADHERVILTYADINEEKSCGEVEVVGYVMAKDLVDKYVPCRSPTMSHKCAILRADIEDLIVKELT